MSELPKPMLISRKCRGGWFYINRGSIDISHPIGENGLIRISRKQLETAVNVMRIYAKPRKKVKP